MFNKIRKVTSSILSIIFPYRKVKYYDGININSNIILENKTLIENMRDNNDLQKTNSCVWFLPKLINIHAGGTATIFKIANELSIRNSCINYFIFQTNVTSSWKKNIIKYYPNLKFEIITLSQGQKSINDIPYSDVAFCTFWTTAYSLVSYNKCKKKFYLLQDDERLFYPSGSESVLVEGSYTFGFYGITNSHVIKSSYQAISNAATLKYMPGINSSLLKISDYKPSNNPTKIVVYGRPSNSRNVFELLANVLSSIAIELGNRVKISIVGEDFSQKDYKLPPEINILGNVSNTDDIISLYSDADIGISYISTPTISYQQLDILSAGRCLVSIKNGEIENIFNKDEVVFVSNYPEIMKEEIIDLINDKERIARTALNGRIAVRELDWDKTLSNICNFIETI